MPTMKRESIIEQCILAKIPLNATRYEIVSEEVMAQLGLRAQRSYSGDFFLLHMMANRNMSLESAVTYWNKYITEGSIIEVEADCYA